MTTLHFVGPDADPFVSQLLALSAHADMSLAGTSSTSTATVQAMRSADVDAILFPLDWADLMRIIRASLQFSPKPALIIITERPSPTALVRAIASGFDGMVSTDTGPARASERILGIIGGTWKIESEPALRGLALTPGLLAQNLIFDSPDDQQIADLVGTGLPDDEIALLLGKPLQLVRNRIENLLAVNELKYRTQLAVIRASSLQVPDFS